MSSQRRPLPLIEWLVVATVLAIFAVLLLPAARGSGPCGVAPPRTT